MTVVILTGLFLISSVELDKNTYNILLEQTQTGDMVAHWETKNIFKEGEKKLLKIKAECESAYEVLEGNGTRGIWRPEDDYFVNKKTLICNSIFVEDL